MGVNLARLSELDLEKGTIEDTPIPLLLGAAKVWEVTGELALERDKAHKKIFFLQGLPVYCKSNLSGESLTQVMYKAGKIDHQTMLHAQALMKQDRLEEDQALLKLGALDESSRYSHLQELSRKRILALFGWAGGSYTFEATEDFIENIDLFDIAPLEVIHEGMASPHVLDIAKIIQDAASEIVVASDQIEEFHPFIERFFPDIKPVWPDNDKTTLGELLPRLHGDITKSLHLAFILVATGGLLLGGKKPCEDNQPAVMLEVDWEDAETQKAVSEEIFTSDPWGAKAESPSLDDHDDAPEIHASMAGQSSPDPWSAKAESPNLNDTSYEPDMPMIPLVQQPAKTAPLKTRIVSKVQQPPETPKPDTSKKVVEPPPEPPWKKTTIKPLDKSIFDKRAASPKHAPSKTPLPKISGLHAHTGKLDPDLKNRFTRMLDIVRRGDPFEILDASIETPRSEIKKAFFYRHTQFSPDKAYALGPDGTRIVDEIQRALRNALDVLTDPARRHDAETRIAEEEKKKAWSMELRKELAKKQFIRGKWYLSQKLPNLALTFFDSAANMDADQAHYYAFLGWAEYASRHSDAGASMAFIRTALGINSKLSEAHLFLGWINKDIGEQKKAVECFEKALAADPNNAYAQQELGKAPKPDKKTSDGSPGLFKRFFGK